jgi:hypothetical protein
MHRNILSIFRSCGGLLLLLGALAGAGCRTTGGPDLPALVDPAKSAVRYTPEQFKQDAIDYRAALASNDARKATMLRDGMINRVRLEIDGNYHIFEQRIFATRAAFATGADWVELFLAGATAAVGGEQSKTILGIVLTGVKGARLSLDKNFFREKTTETLLASMQGERTKRLALLTRKMTEGDASQYSWDEAWVDLLDYFYAGTLESGLLAIAAQAGAEATVGKAAVRDAEQKRVDKFSLQAATQEEILEVRELTRRLGTLDKETARRILDELRIQHGPNDDPLELLRGQIDALQPGDDSGRLRLSKAFQKIMDR